MLSLGMGCPANVKYRDEAMKQTRRLQIAILEERGRLKAISG